MRDPPRSVTPSQQDAWPGPSGPVAVDLDPSEVGGDDASRQAHPMIWSERVALPEPGLVDLGDAIGVEDDEVGVLARRDPAFAVAQPRQVGGSRCQPPGQVDETEATPAGTVPGGGQPQL